jgi:ABC-type dipeptide/oligopeptide/nickel transport system permease subunit
MTPIPAPPAAGRSLWGEAWQRLKSQRGIRLCLWILAIYTAAAFFGEAVYWRSRNRDEGPAYQRIDMNEAYQPPSLLNRPFARARTEAGPGAGWTTVAAAGVRHLFHHPMGTDNLGRDVLQRLTQGARIAFQVGVITSLIAIPIGVILGCLAGYLGGRTDDAIVWLYSTVASMPGLLFILAISMVVGKGLKGVYLGIGLMTWTSLCRLIRAEVMKHKERPYVLAARTLGAGPVRIMFRHILPNVFHIVIIAFSLRFPAAIGTEVFMSFLGIGVQSEPSWGIMISNARLRLWHGMWWEMTFVTLAVFLVVLAFNLVGDALRDALDPRLRAGKR